MEMGLGQLACDCAALLNERDLFRLSVDERHVDIRSRLEALHDKRMQARYKVERTTLQRVLQASKALQRRLKTGPGSAGSEHTGRLLALAYPDRIAQKRPNTQGRYLLSNGRGASINEQDLLAGTAYLVAAELDGSQREARIFLAAPINEAELETLFSEQITRLDKLAWDMDKGMVSASRQKRLGHLVLDQVPIVGLTEEQLRLALLEGIRQSGIDCLPWDRESRQWQQRVLFLGRCFPDQGWPDVSDTGLLASLEVWLLPYLNKMNKLSQLKSLPLMSILNNTLDWDQQQALKSLAPSHIQVPSGSRIAIDYTGEPPILAVRLQELFGLNETPSIANGKVALLLHLLSPARRPMQVTQDLKSFWENTYAEVKKDLKGQYPKHYWPDDPMQAEATSRAKPRK